MSASGSEFSPPQVLNPGYAQLYIFCGNGDKISKITVCVDWRKVQTMNIRVPKRPSKYKFLVQQIPGTAEEHSPSRQAKQLESQELRTSARRHGSM